LNVELLPKLDNGLQFLTYMEYGKKGSINIAAAGLVQNKDCWSVLRFTALKKQAETSR
jgi:hypothetical protein